MKHTHPPHPPLFNLRRRRRGCGIAMWWQERKSLREDVGVERLPIRCVFPGSGGPDNSTRSLNILGNNDT